MIKDIEMEARHRDLRMLRYLFDTQKRYEIRSRDLYRGCAMSSKTFSRLKHLAYDGTIGKGGNGECRNTWKASHAA